MCIRDRGDSPWGTFLDAGTGVQSLRWIAELGTERWTGVSASPAHAERVREAIKEAQRPEDQVVLGNWVDTDLLKGEQYDTVMADYLLGAIEGFAPYYQPYLFKRLRPLTRTRPRAICAHYASPRPCRAHIVGDWPLSRRLRLAWQRFTLPRISRRMGCR